MSLEGEVLLACARASLDAETRARLADLLARPLDGPRLVRLAERHGLVPLMNHHLGAASTAPAPVRDELQARTRAIAARNLKMTSELGRVASRLESRGISVLAYKGPLLAETAYGSIALRSFDDLDLLIAREHVLEAKRLMLEDGYRPLYALTAAQEAAYLRSQCEYIVERDDVRVELHWAIVPDYFSFPIDLERVRTRAVPASAGGIAVRTMSPEDLTLALCAHGAKHCWDRLEWVASFAEVVRRHPSMDWGDIRRSATRAGGRRMLDLSLWLAHELIGAPLPSTELTAIAHDATARALAAAIGRRLRSGDLGTLDRQHEVQFHLRARDRVRDRLRYALRLGTTQTLGDWELVGLPAGAGALYRLIRPLRLLGKFGPRVVTRSLRALSGRPGPERSGSGEPR